jgi:hypothetical protein
MCSSLALLSLTSSSQLVWLIKKSHRAGWTTMYHRILLGMSIADIFHSLSLAHFNLMAPSMTPTLFGMHRAMR